MHLHSTDSSQHLPASWTDTQWPSHKNRWVVFLLFIGKGSIMQLLKSSVIQKSVFIGCHEFWQIHAKGQGKQSSLIVILEVRIYCHRLSWRMKPGSAILKSRRWNGTAIHLHGRRNSRVQLGGKIVVIVFWNENGVILLNYWSRGHQWTLKCHTDGKKSECSSWSILSHRKNVGNVAFTRKFQAVHKCVNHRGHHKFWMDIVASSTLQYWPSTVR